VSAFASCIESYQYLVSPQKILTKGEHVCAVIIYN